MSGTDSVQAQGAAAPARGNWFAIGAYATLAAATQTLAFTYTPITSLAADFYSVSEAFIGGLAIVVLVVFVVLALPSGVLLDRWFRPMVLLGAATTALGAIMRVVDPTSASWATYGQIVIAVGQPLVLGAVTKLCVDYLPRRHRATGISIGTAGLFVGMLIAFITGAMLQNNIAMLLAVQAGLAAMAAVGMGIALAKPGRFADQIDVSSSVDLEESHEHPLRTVVRDPALLPLVAIVAIGFGVFIALTTWIEALLEPAGVNASASSIILIILVSGGVAGTMVLPAIAAKQRNQPRYMAAAFLMSAIGCLALAILPSAWVGYLTAGLLGFLLLSTLPMALDIVEQRAGEAVSTATSAIWLAVNLGGVALSFTVGLFLDRPSIGFVLLAVVALGAGLPSVGFLRRSLTSTP